MNLTPIGALVAEVYAKLGWTGMMSLKLTPIWDPLG